MSARIHVSLVVLAAAIGATSPLVAQAIDDRLAEARRRYDLDLARVVLQSVAEIQPGDPASSVTLAVEAALLVAELERIDFEEASEAKGPTRREIGARIDEAARRGLNLLDSLEESSETWRRRADLVGTLIRSKFRGKKYRARMERSAARAIELDPSNAKARVSAAKPSLLRPGREAADLEAGLILVEEALEIDPTLETALLLRGRALWELGRKQGADEDWRRALELNPDCRPAQQWLSGNL